MAAGAVAGLLAASAAQAAPGFATGDVNMRTGPGTNYARITTIPEGAPVEVFECPTWCQVEFNGRQGWVSSNYIAGDNSYEGAALYEPAPSVVVYSRPAIPPRAYWRYGEPWWDDRYDAWYDGHRYWYGDRWYDRPRSGVSFSFGFGD
jgi:uncharacterized protein YraI